MSTFLEFYVALLRFVNHKLFIDLGFKHPLEDEAMRADGLYLDVERIRAMQKLARKKFAQG